MTALLLATRNAHKTREIQQVLAGDYIYLTLRDFPGAPAAVEDGATFEANAAKKVSVLAGWLAANPRMPEPVASALGADPSIPAFYVLADDSGLEVEALSGAPGVHSARFAAPDSGAGENSPDSANNAKLLRLLQRVPAARRTARFRCVLALRRLFLPSAAETVLFEGVCAGRIGLRPAGGGGFGYDPLFIPDGCTQSFAELGEAAKNSLSHRSLALQKLSQYLRKP
jgi:XTP/dITP diphosphohydrolase